GVDAVLGGAVRLRRNVELRQRLPDLRVLVGRLQLDRLELVRGPGLVGLAAGDDLRVGHALLRLRMMYTRLSRVALALRHAEHVGSRLDERDPAGGAGAAHRVEVHSGAPAAAGNCGAENRIVV